MAEALGHEQPFQRGEHEVVVGVLIVGKHVDILQKLAELNREPLTKCGGRNTLLDLPNLLQFLLMRGPLHPLPRQAALQEINEAVKQRFEVVSAALLDAGMVVDACKPHIAHKAALFFVGFVLVVRSCVKTRQAEIDEVKLVVVRGHTNQKVVRLHITVNQALAVKEHHVCDKLSSDLQHRLQGESATTAFKKTLQVGSKQIHHENVVALVLAHPSQRREAITSS
mmetsp:Transcript_10943/g.27660  ORF Transcript_10943/g.27660 Transcript_10943/m.27660 type:complete len:225 (+) Transcript_10943:305-979(+)